MDIHETIAASLGVAWASGINLYAAVFMIGAMGACGVMEIPPGLMILTHPAVLISSGLMFFMEFFADKVPGVDSAWDAAHTFIRIPAGAVLAAQAIGDVHPAYTTAAALIGGSLAAGTHVTKAGTRALANTSPEPFSNWFLSISEDLLVVAGIWTALSHPYVFLCLLGLFVIAMAIILPKLIRLLYRVGRGVGRLFRRQSPELTKV